MPSENASPVPSSALTALEQALPALSVEAIGQLIARSEPRRRADYDCFDRQVVSLECKFCGGEWREGLPENHYGPCPDYVARALLRLAATREQEARDMEARLRTVLAKRVQITTDEHWLYMLWQESEDSPIERRRIKHDATPEGIWSATLAALDQAREVSRG